MWKQGFSQTLSIRTIHHGRFSKCALMRQCQSLRDLFTVGQMSIHVTAHVWRYLAPNTGTHFSGTLRGVFCKVRSRWILRTIRKFETPALSHHCCGIDRVTWFCQRMWVQVIGCVLVILGWSVSKNPRFSHQRTGFPQQACLNQSSNYFLEFLFYFIRFVWRLDFSDGD